MEIPQSVIDEIILKLHQSKQSTVLLGGTNGKSAHDVALHTSKIRHRNQKQAIEDAIGVVLEFASDNVKARLGSTYAKSPDLKEQSD
jgi:hypothetical protein